MAPCDRRRLANKWLTKAASLTGMGKTMRRDRRTGTLFQRCEKRLGCPPLGSGEPDPETGRPTRAKHKCRGAWVASVSLPPGPDNVRRRKAVVRAKYADAVKELQKLNRELDKAGDLATSSPTLSAWLDVWLDRYLPRLKMNTRPSYRSRIRNYIRPAIGHIRLDRLGPAHVARLRDYITQDKGLSSSTALGAHRVLSVILRDAHRERLISENPCALIDAPKKRVRKITYLDTAQARDLLASCDPGDGTVPRDLALAATALLTGVRPGERLGITDDMIDLAAGTITIAWQLQRLEYEHGCGEQGSGRWPCGRKRGGNCPSRALDIPEDQEVRHVEGGLYLTRPKTRAGWREFTMPPPLLEALRIYRRDNEPGLCGLLFTREHGRPIDPSDDSRWWDALLRTAGLPDVDRKSARHTCNTILKELGYPVDVRQKIIGHASAAVNEQVYTHASDAEVTKATAALGVAMDWRAP